ncbi:hypothetical protein C5C45_00020 [Rathayibacter rathayi]|uniref:Uncharacterized protein n=1 Tax=Rathayibacter rathayi TaxID=33887 RepID=A0ABX5A880_RATRA|nr:hypothetical protein C5C34_14965 [Rathayibacter rathayi]PPF42467.1 hypothetical protein C5C08_15005 [Rathayibacter rathayi]PPF75116.1 hypothetical protein C5C14_15035 [Rathayibacter rathayi]PPG09840.1 hypothetical protein C5C11_15015 [Rathayibacter rathayi]PPG47097.1 hypothetical protein C5C20_02385 [Rathayibacter rathayi]
MEDHRRGADGGAEVGVVLGGTAVGNEVEGDQLFLGLIGHVAGLLFPLAQHLPVGVEDLPQSPDMGGGAVVS